MKYLLDTNICIHIIRRKPPKVFGRFREHRVGDIGISAITYSELEYGVANSGHPEQNEIALAEFVAPLEIFDFQKEVAPLYGRIRAHLSREGRPIGPLDLLIAAHAAFLGCVLVTNNTREYSRIPDVKIENWT